MADDKRNLVHSPTFSAMIPEMSTAAIDRKPIKKYIVIAASVLVGVALVLTATLVGIHLLAESHKDILMFSQQLDKGTKLDVIGDRDNNVVQYHTQNENYDMWVVDDFNRDIQVLKVDFSGKVNCYVTPLNRNTEGDPSKVFTPSTKMASNGSSPVQISKSAVYFSSLKSPIQDRSFLSKTATDVCKGFPIYWTVPSCDAPGAGESGRQKRGLCCAVTCICCPVRCGLVCVPC